MMVKSDVDSGSFIRSDAETLPLLADSASEKEGRELGIFADNSLKDKQDSDLASQGMSGTIPPEIYFVDRFFSLGYLCFDRCRH